MATIADLRAIGIPSRDAGILGADWQDWTPSYSGEGSLSWAGVTAVARYIQIGKLVIFQVDATGTTTGSDDNGLEFTLPVTASSATGNPAIGAGYVTSTTTVQGFALLSSTTLGVARRYDSGNFGIGSGRQLSIIGAYEAA